MVAVTALAIDAVLIVDDDMGCRKIQLRNNWNL